MSRIVAALLALVLAGPALARPALAQEVGPSDRQAIVAVISDQLAAFRSRDAVRAFSYASPAIQAKFGTPADFLEMVRTGYQPVYDARNASFRNLTMENGVPVQAVELHGEGGEGVLALYFMEHEPDGSWKISGCVLVKLPEQSA